MRRIMRWATCGVLACAGCAGVPTTPPPAVSPATPSLSRTALAAQTRALRAREGDTVILTGVGVTNSPDTFLVSTQLDYYLGPQLAVGPSLQIGLSSDADIVAPTFHTKWVFDLASDGDLARIRPFVQGGAGFAWIHKDRDNGDDDDIGLLMQGGLGLEIAIHRHLHFSSTLLVNYLPDEVLGEDFFLSWNALQFGWRF